MDWWTSTSTTKRPKKRKRLIDSSIPTEDQEQKRLATWMANRGIKFFAIPMGGSRHIAEAVKLKACGAMPGIPDLMIPVARKSYNGLFIELKRVKGGVVSFNQTYWLESLTKEGYLAVVCRGADEAIAVIEDYFKV